MPACFHCDNAYGGATEINSNPWADMICLAGARAATNSPILGSTWTSRVMLYSRRNK